MTLKIIKSITEHGTDQKGPSVLICDQSRKLSIMHLNLHVKLLSKILRLASLPYTVYM